MKPELLHDERIATRSDTARLLYYGLLGIVDDAGRAKAAPAYLHGQVFWGAPRSLKKIESAISELESAGLIRIYEANEGQYLEVVDWSVKGSLTFQQIDRAQPSALPEPSRTVKPKRSTNKRRASGEGTATLPLGLDARSGSSISDQEHERDQDQEHGALAPHTPAVRFFHESYLAAYGSKPRWNAKPIAMIKSLVEDVGCDETIRRIGIMFKSPPSWLRPPFDVGTLVQHFDKFVAAAVEPARKPAHGGLSPDDLLDIAARERAKRLGGNVA